MIVVMTGVAAASTYVTTVNNPSDSSANLQIWLQARCCCFFLVNADLRCEIANLTRGRVGGVGYIPACLRPLTMAGDNQSDWQMRPANILENHLQICLLAYCQREGVRICPPLRLSWTAASGCSDLRTPAALHHDEPHIAQKSLRRAGV